MMSGAIDERYVNPYGWLNDPNCDDDDQEFSVMDLMRAGGMSLEAAHSALYVEDLGTFCSKLADRVPFVTRGFGSDVGIKSSGSVDEVLIEQDVQHEVPFGCECVPVGVSDEREVDLVDLEVKMDIDELTAHQVLVDEKCTRGGEYILPAIPYEDGTVRYGPESTLVEKCPTLDSAIVSVRGRWDERHCGIITYLAGIARGVTLTYSTLCPLAGEHEGVEFDEFGFHGCCQDWAKLLGRLGRTRIVPHSSGGGVVCMFFGSGIPPGLRDVEPAPAGLRRGCLFPIGGGESGGLQRTDDASALIYGTHSLITGGPRMLHCSEGVDVDDVGLLFRDEEHDMGFLLMRRYLTTPAEPGSSAVLAQRGDWRWYHWTNPTVGPGTYVVSLALITEESANVNPLMATSWDDNEPCGFTVQVTFLDCLSSEMAPLSFRQAAMHAQGLPVCWAGINGNYYLSDLYPSTGSAVVGRACDPLITLSGELVMRSRAEGLALSQQPFGAIARASPGWSGKFCTVLAKQWCLIRTLWASKLQTPDKFLGIEEVRAVARRDMLRWGFMDFVSRGRTSESLFVQWIVSEQEQGRLYWIPPPALAVLDPCGSDSAHWNSASTISTGFGGEVPLPKRKFLRRVGANGGKLMPDHWRPKYSAMLKYADPEVVGMMVQEWGSVPLPITPPPGEEDVPGLPVFTKARRTAMNDGGWPVYNEGYDTFVDDDDVITLVTGNRLLDNRTVREDHDLSIPAHNFKLGFKP